ncbi:MAG: hypothetical protein WAW52_03270 [Methanothrix sp.]
MPGGPFGWLRLRSRWLVSLAGPELQGIQNNNSRILLSMIIHLSKS